MNLWGAFQVTSSMLKTFGFLLDPCKSRKGIDQYIPLVSWPFVMNCTNQPTNQPTANEIIHLGEKDYNYNRLIYSSFFYCQSFIQLPRW